VSHAPQIVTQVIIQCSDTQLSVHDVTDGDVTLYGLNTAVLYEAEGCTALQVPVFSRTYPIDNTQFMLCHIQ